MHTRRPFVLAGSCLFTVVLVTGNRPNYDRRDPTRPTCTDVAKTVAPGTRIDLNNPCDPTGAWPDFGEGVIFVTTGEPLVVDRPEWQRGRCL